MHVCYHIDDIDEITSVDDVEFDVNDYDDLVDILKENGYKLYRNISDDDDVQMVQSIVDYIIQNKQHSSFIKSKEDLINQVVSIIDENYHLVKKHL